MNWEYSHVLCPHGEIDPSARDLRLISHVAFTRLEELHGGKSFPELDICRECILEEHEKRSAQAAKSDQVAEFNTLNQDIMDGEDVYVLPKAWLRAWTSDKLPSGSRPTDKAYTLFCEHGRPKQHSQGHITHATPAAVILLQSVLGDFDVFKEGDEMCSTCLEQDRQDSRDYADWGRQVKLEKQIAKKHRNAWHVFKAVNYLLPRGFADAWNKYLEGPGPRPGRLDPELCQHGLLDLDPELDEGTYLDEAGWVKLCGV